MEHKTDIEKPKMEDIYSEAVHDILSDPPKSIFMWGNFIALIFIIILLSLSWIVSYPDLISSQIIITTHIPPEKLVAKSTGKIQKIFINNNDFVTAGTNLAVIENQSNYEDVFLLKSIIDSIQPTPNFVFPIEKISKLNLGNIEKAYEIFEKNYVAYRINTDLAPYKADINAQKSESVLLQQRLRLLLEQKSVVIAELTYKQKEIDRYKKLFDKGIISQQEWEAKNLEYLEQEKKSTNLKSQIFDIQSSINDLHKNHQTTNLNKTRDDVNLNQNVNLSYNQLKNAILDWEINYLIKATIPGQVSFLKIWVENQTINLGEESFVIIPKQESNFIGKTKAPVSNSGKIKIGQNVNIRLTNYPDREFGIIKGVVKNISMTPDSNNNILVDVHLPYGVKTSYNKEIVFQQEMSGKADIITQDLRLLERILYQFREIIKR